MAHQQSFEQMEDKQEVRGMEFSDGVWTGRYFQPTLLCKHIRESLESTGWWLTPTAHFWNGEGCTLANQFIPTQKCEHAHA